MKRRDFLLCPAESTATEIPLGATFSFSSVAKRTLITNEVKPDGSGLRQVHSIL
ncbi:hypothetical protein [Algoriphagus sp. AGSA1]|uniref:hypothetical protein n=1 Tax=Algoriphagus sp. AGSA1 TaxID=2907213 RepID=UPI001F2E85B1|nr:hypothetical protein [Algoriphagus sp. AGSA1]